MKDSMIMIILLQVVLIFLNAVFACAEIAVISMNDNKLAKMAAEGDKRAVRLAQLTSQPARFLATIQVAITLSGFLGSAFAAENFSGILVEALVKTGIPIAPSILDSVSVIFITIVLSYFTLVFGELVPKQIAMRKAEPLALAMSGMISGIAKIFAPLVNMLTMSTNGILRMLGIDPNGDTENVSEEEIRMMVDAGSEKGTIDHEEREFIQNVFEFDDLTAEEILTHRTEVIMLDVEESAEGWKDTIFRTRHTLYPVCQGTADKVIGVMNAKDYFRLDSRDLENVMKQAVNPAYFVPDTIKADVLFRNMKKRKETMAVVLDEYGGVTGILTINDLIEQLVGDLGEDEEEHTVEQLEENVWKISGGIPLEEVSEQLGISLSCEEYDTFSGLIFHHLQSIPEDGTDVEIEFSGLKIRVTEIEDHQVKTAIVQKTEK
ncbi:MAG: hemolysin family protein [Eubacteriales bacterium]|nr:hemolysin family protein [Eubacteriales bacterium]